MARKKRSSSPVDPHKENNSPQNQSPQKPPVKPARTKNKTVPVTKPECPVSVLRKDMIDNMNLSGLAASTQANYLSAMVKLQNEHVGIRLDRLSEKQVSDYVFWLRDKKNCSRGAFQTNFYALKFFYYRCLNYQWPLFTIKRVRLPKKFRLPVPVYPEEARSIIAGLHLPMYRVFASCLYLLGLRMEEAATLNVHSIEAKNMTVRVIGKGNKERLLPLQRALYQQLRELWATHRHPELLFPNQAGTGHLCVNSFRTAFRDACNQAGLPEKIVPHSLRHGFATTLLQAGVALHLVQELLGHSNIATTQIYTHLTTPLLEELRVKLDDLCHDLDNPPADLPPSPDKRSDAQDDGQLPGGTDHE